MNLSIVIPAYNVENYIGNTLESLANQSEKNFEVIIVDDGSADKTLEIAKKAFEDFEFLAYKIITKKNGGVSSARNKGLIEASGTYVMFLDGDDYVSSDLVENIYRNINEKSPDIICWGYNLVTEDKKTVANYFNKYKCGFKNMNGIDAFIKKIINRSMWIWTGSAAYKREFLIENNLKFTEGCFSGEDKEFIFKALALAKEVIFIDKVLSYYVQRNGSISNSYNIKRFDAIDALKRAYEYINSISNADVKDICEFIKYEQMIGSYLYNFNSCLNNVTQISKKRKNNTDYLFNEIEKNYPGLNREIMFNMRNYKGKNIKLFIRIKLFLISPEIYNWVSRIKKIFNDIRRGE